ncbi:hypothetical protein [Pontibacterium sp.]|uniref:hypothetical protein n=1 Tax=Pontibacterium sp. TaxID=2036026 RepID=UPI003514147D
MVFKPAGNFLLASAEKHYASLDAQRAIGFYRSAVYKPTVQGNFNDFIDMADLLVVLERYRGAHLDRGLGPDMGYGRRQKDCPSQPEPAEARVAKLLIHQLTVRVRC